MEGKLKFETDVVEGLRMAPASLSPPFRGKNLGSSLVKVATSRTESGLRVLLQVIRDLGRIMYEQKRTRKIPNIRRREKPRARVELMLMPAGGLPARSASQSIRVPAVGTSNPPPWPASVPPALLPPWSGGPARARRLR